MTAKEMFEELGWYQWDDSEDSVSYADIPSEGATTWTQIVFDKMLKTWHAVHIIDGRLDIMAVHIYPNLHKIINKQCEELGWLDENC